MQAVRYCALVFDEGLDGREKELMPIVLLGTDDEAVRRRRNWCRSATALRWRR
jgi:hypothetical protein